MEQTVLKIALAGLMHDVGKFAERAFAADLGDKDSVHQDYRYGHAYSTEQVLNYMFPGVLEKTVPNPLDIKDCTVLNLAARHHKPRHVYERMISEADCIASGHERAKADTASDFKTEGRERKSQVPLLSILGRVHLNKTSVNKESANMRYRVTPPPLGHGGISELGFPVSPEEYDAAQVRADYKKHWQKFRDATNGIDPEKQFETFFEICRMYQWCLPASVRKEEIPDVSLFEHQKATAALASCLFLYHHHQGDSLTEIDIRDRAEKKYLLFCGDISGIQSFIYRISSKGAYKNLKGRSFFVQLLAEILARRFIEEFGLTISNILYASGGKFYLLLPRTGGAGKSLSRLSDEINLELFKRFNGDIFIRTGCEVLSGNDLTGGSGRNLSRIWDDLGHKLLVQDRSRYSSIARSHYDAIFGVSGKENHTDCQVCHRSMAPRKNNEERQCKPCREMVEIGRKLGVSDHIAMAKNENAIDGRYDLALLGNYFWFVGAERQITPHHDCLIWSLNDTDFYQLAKESTLSTVNAAPMVVGSTHRFDREFDKIAEESNGIHRLGVLRMDVDNLGRIFSHGLQNYLHEGNKDPGRFHSLGRITTLSWQLSLFFGAMVPALIRNKKEWTNRVTVVYSGGDDLFLLGAWDALPNVARKIRSEFCRFSCGNPTWGISGGMVMTDGKFPIYKSAEMAGEAEEQAKKAEMAGEAEEQAKKIDKKKNAFTFLDTTMKWDEFERISKVQEELFQHLQVKENRPLLTRLSAISSSWAASRDRMIRAEGSIPIATIQQNLLAEKWRWQMVYSLKRLGESRKNLNEAIKEIQRFILQPVPGGNRTGIELLGVISRWCELQLRNPKSNSKGGK